MRRVASRFFCSTTTLNSITHQLVQMTSQSKELSNDEEEQILEEIAELEKELNGKDPHVAMKEHIDLLHEYNELKDATQGMIGKMANMKDTTITQLHDDYGLTLGD